MTANIEKTSNDLSVMELKIKTLESAIEGLQTSDAHLATQVHDLIWRETRSIQWLIALSVALLFGFAVLLFSGNPETPVAATVLGLKLIAILVAMLLPWMIFFQIRRLEI